MAPKPRIYFTKSDYEKGRSLIEPVCSWFDLEVVRRYRRTYTHARPNVQTTIRAIHNTTAHGVGTLERGGQDTRGKASTGVSLKQPHPQQRAAAAAAAGARAGTGGRMAPYSSRPQRQRQEREQLAPMGYQPVRGGKRNKPRGAAAMDVMPSSGLGLYPAMAQESMSMYGANGAAAAAAAAAGQGTGRGKVSTALATAQAIINSAAPHPKKAEIKQVGVHCVCCLLSVVHGTRHTDTLQPYTQTTAGTGTPQGLGPAQELPGEPCEAPVVNK